MVACASQDSSAPLGYDEARAQHLFTAGYQDVADIYIHEVAVADLAVAGLSSLAIIDPAIGIQSNGGRLRITIDGRQMASYPLPAEHHAQAWGMRTPPVPPPAPHH